MKTFLKIVTSSYVTPFNILVITGIAMVGFGTRIASSGGMIISSIGAVLLMACLARMAYALYEGWKL